MSTPQDQIVFEDLHGVSDEETVTVDLDADLKDAGIERKPAEQAADVDAGNDDDITIDDLRTADNADDSAGDDDDASTDGEDGNYSRKVKARIQRATRATKSAKDEATYWRDQAQKFAKDQVGRDKSELETVVERSTVAIGEVETDLERAIEDGDTKSQVRLTSQLTDFKAEKIQAEVALKDLPSDVTLQPFDGNVQSSDDTDQSSADKWMDKRADWYGASGFERQTRLANRLDREVFADGYDPKTAEYFAELDRRIKEKQPKLYDDADDDGDNRQNRRTPVAPVGGAEVNRNRRSGSKVELGEDDFANMRRFGLDPNNPEVLKEYAANKRETLGGRR